jgi:hypothetical protein
MRRTTGSASGAAVSTLATTSCCGGGRVGLNRMTRRSGRSGLGETSRWYLCCSVARHARRSCRRCGLHSFLLLWIWMGCIAVRGSADGYPFLWGSPRIVELAVLPPWTAATDVWPSCGAYPATYASVASQRNPVDIESYVNYNGRMRVKRNKNRPLQLAGSPGITPHRASDRVARVLR